MRPSQINAHALEWSTSNDWLQLPTTRQLSTMITTASWTTATKPDCICPPTKPESTSLDLVTSFTNAHVATAHPAMRQFNDVLTHFMWCQQLHPIRFTISTEPQPVHNTVPNDKSKPLATEAFSQFACQL